MAADDPTEPEEAFDDDGGDDGDDGDDGGDGGDGGDDGDGAPRPLPPDERESVQADLNDLRGMREVFEPQGAKGVVIHCTDCGMNHYFAWDLLQETLEHMLQTGEPRMHEPAFAPNEEEYIAWDYAKGYLDALTDTGLDPESRLDVHACPWCSTRLQTDYAFCPKCGKPLAVARLYVDLVERGLDEREVRVMLARAGFDPPT